MSYAGRGDALPREKEPTVNAITWAYVEAADGDALVALRLAVTERMVSRGFIRAGASADQRSAR